MEQKTRLSAGHSVDSIQGDFSSTEQTGRQLPNCRQELSRQPWTEVCLDKHFASWLGVYYQPIGTKTGIAGTLSGASDATRCGSKARLSEGQTTEARAG